MLSYRHAFHAGNIADVLKHSILIFCLDYLTKKESPLFCADTHAGAGLYPLQTGFAAQNREWENGLGKLLNTRDKLPAILRRYLEICAADNGCYADDDHAPSAPETYPGSPLIMAKLLRSGDRLVCFELHPADFALCEANLNDALNAHTNTGLRRAEVYAADGFAGLKGLLPPPSRRGLVLIDPPYEVKDDYSRTLQTLSMALKRFAAGTYIVWYPLLRNAPFADTAGADSFAARLMNLYAGKRCKIELYTATKDKPPENSPRGMYGSGLVVYNPPWTLTAEIVETMPVLASLAGTGKSDSGCKKNSVCKTDGGFCVQFGSS